MNQHPTPNNNNNNNNFQTNNNNNNNNNNEQNKQTHPGALRQPTPKKKQNDDIHVVANDGSRASL
jgi:hypothetical protein